MKRRDFLPRQEEFGAFSPVWIAHAGLWSMRIPDWAEEDLAGIGLRLLESDTEIVFGHDMAGEVRARCIAATERLIAARRAPLPDIDGLDLQMMPDGSVRMSGILARSLGAFRRMVPHRRQGASLLISKDHCSALLAFLEWAAPLARHWQARPDKFALAVPGAWCLLSKEGVAGLGGPAIHALRDDLLSMPECLSPDTERAFPRFAWDDLEAIEARLAELLRVREAATLASLSDQGLLAQIEHSLSDLAARQDAFPQIRRAPLWLFVERDLGRDPKPAPRPAPRDWQIDLLPGNRMLYSLPLLRGHRQAPQMENIQRMADWLRGL